MVPPRACLLCQAAKARCDRVRPTCGRCRLRGLICSGLQAETEFMFRDETVVAQQNSERARRSPRHARVLTVSFELTRSPEQWLQPESSTKTSSPRSRPSYPWLAADHNPRLSAPLERDSESRAIDRFFIDWTLYPCNNGSRPGHMAELPLAYFSAGPRSTLWFSVRALAFAGLRRLPIDKESAVTKALRNYGSALSQLKKDMKDKDKICSNDVLAALLLIDDFESIYLARTEPLGPHSVAIMHIFQARGACSFLNDSSCSFWRVAHHRLQARQILFRQDPIEEQKQWVTNLNTDLTWFHISADVQQMSILSAAARRLNSGITIEHAAMSGRAKQARDLIQTITEFLTSMEEWTATLTGTWKPKHDEPDQIQPTTSSDPYDVPIPHFTCPNILSHHDIWSAEKWVFHAASQIVLRESLIDIIHYAVSLESQELDSDDIGQIYVQELMVDRLSSIIIRTFPQLLGFTRRETQEMVSPYHGIMIGRFYSLFPLETVRRAQFTSDQHKETASEVIAWIQSCHGLG